MAFDPETFVARPEKKKPDGAGFDEWYGKTASRMKLDPNPDAPEHYYDYRAFYKDVQAGKAKDPEKGGHFTSAYKLPGHPREFLNDSAGRMFNTKTGEYVESKAPVPSGELKRAGNAPTLPQRIVPGEAKKAAFDPNTFVAQPATPAAAPEPSTWDKLKGLFKGTGDAMAGQAVGIGRAARQAVTGGFYDNLAGAANAIDPFVEGTMGDKYRAGRDSIRAEDTESASEHPLVSAATTGTIGYLVPQVASIIKGAGAAAAVGRAALAGGEGAATALGYSNAKDTDEAVRALKTGAGIPLALHGAVGLAAGAGKGVALLAEKTLGKEGKGSAAKSAAERLSDQMLSLSVVRGADQTAAKRAVGTPQQVDMLADLARRDPALRKAIRAKDHNAMIEETDRILDEARPQTAPVYRAVDQAVGEVKVADPVRVVQDEIAAIRKTPGRSAEEGRIPGLEAIAKRLESIAEAKPGRKPIVKDLAAAQERGKALRFEAADLRSRGPASAKQADALEAEAARIVEAARAPELEPGTLTTQDLRDEVTGLLKQKFQTMGSIAETSGYAHKADNHELLNTFLNERLDAAGVADPAVAEQVARVRHVNRDMATALNIQSAAESSIARSARQAKGIDDVVGDAANKGVLRAGAGAMLAGPAGAAAAIAPFALKTGTREATFALADFSAKVRIARAAGQPVPADAIAAAIAAGVPRAFVQAVVKQQAAND